MLKQIGDINIAGKRVLLRVDFNVPIREDGSIRDDSRIRAVVPTIERLLTGKAKIILMSHLGRPKGKTPSCSLRPCAQRLSELLGKPVRFVDDCRGPSVREAISAMKDGDIVMLENLRFYEGEEHPEKDKEFVRELASFGDVYINDAFGTAHRAHASTAAIAEFFPHTKAIGPLMMKEVQALQSLLVNPVRPFLAIVGGAKVSTKLGVLKSLLDRVDRLLIGGAMTFTFMRALGLSTGDSPCEDEMVPEAMAVMQKAQQLGKEVTLPVDFVVVQHFSNDAEALVVPTKDGIPEGFQGMDIGPRTIEKWRPLIEEARTIFWNGPVGVFEFSRFAKGTERVAACIAENTRAFSVVGGGDSLAAVEKSGYAQQISHLSTGGGASLELIEYLSLPGIEALNT